MREEEDKRVWRKQEKGKWRKKTCKKGGRKRGEMLVERLRKRC